MTPIADNKTDATPTPGFTDGALSAPLATGSPITSLPVTALPTALGSGTQVFVRSGANTQIWVLTADAVLGATALSVASQAPNFAYPSGSVVATLGDHAAHHNAIADSANDHETRLLSVESGDAWMGRTAGDVLTIPSSGPPTWEAPSGGSSGPAARDAPGNLGSAYTWPVASRVAVDLVATVDQNTTITVTGLVTGGRYRLYLTMGAGGPFTCQITDGFGTPVAVSLGALPGDLSVVYLDVPTTGFPVAFVVGVGTAPDGSATITAPAATVTFSARVPVLSVPITIVAPSALTTWTAPVPSVAGSVNILAPAATATFSIPAPAVLVPFDPLALPSPLFGFQSAAIAGLSDGATVATWADATAGHHDAVTAGAGTDPVKQTVGGHAVARYASGKRKVVSGLTSNIKPFTLYAVINPTDFATDRAIIGPSTTPGGMLVRIAQTTGLLQILKSNVVLVGASTTALVAGSPVLITAQYDASGNYAFFINGAAAGSGLNNQTFVSLALQIGADATSSYFVGDEYEAWMYGAMHGSTDRGNMETYLKAAFGL